MQTAYVLQAIGIIFGAILMFYLGGDITGKWEANVAYSLTLSMFGLAAFFGAEKLRKTD